jgi:hypothetical protein
MMLTSLYHRACGKTNGVEKETFNAGALDGPFGADIMSDMKTFTVRDLDRSPSVVLAASRTDGRARIRERGGHTYIITPEIVPQKKITGVPDFARRRSKLFKGALSSSTARQFDRAIAGE